VGWYESGSEGPGILASIVGALVLLGAYRLILRARGDGRHVPVAR
jgi:uncharacterized membrane protein YeaQ/YmgE (transglycosylase-associated protein family)